ncbi:MAG TPA: BlaI/MecI/CopY family transcriptional regulator [Vicinamibacteria bacterium]|nr:BlaI/MecI/CopY family transcriptional regulator [Vicinamibacteria bacterium]
MELGPLEERILDLLWRSRGERSVREVQDDLQGSLAYTTVMTTLDRLFKKGLLERKRDGQAYLYATRVSREAFAAGLLKRTLDRVLDRGSATPLLASFVDAVSEHDRELLPELERLVRARERELRKRKRNA